MIFWRFNFQSYLNIYDICRGVYTILLNMRRIDTKWDWFFAYDVPNDVMYIQFDELITTWNFRIQIY